jgi:hypothetical protein
MRITDTFEMCCDMRITDTVRMYCDMLITDTVKMCCDMRITDIVRMRTDMRIIITVKTYSAMRTTDSRFLVIQSFWLNGGQTWHTKSTVYSTFLKSILTPVLVFSVCSDGIPSWHPQFNPRSCQIGFLVGKRCWGRFPLSTLVSPASFYSTEYLSTWVGAIVPLTDGWLSHPTVKQRTSSITNVEEEKQALKNSVGTYLIIWTGSAVERAVQLDLASRMEFAELCSSPKNSWPRNTELAISTIVWKRKTSIRINWG